MADESYEVKETKLRKQVWQFAFAMVKHWEAFLAATLGSGIATVFQAIGLTIPSVVGWICGLLGFFSAAFLAWRDERELRRLEDKQEEDKVRLSVSFEDSNGIDMDLGMRIYRIKITNLHAAKTAEKVRIDLSSFAGGRWESVNVVDATTVAVRKLRLPYPLTVSGARYTLKDAPTFEASLNGGCSLFFDLFSVRAATGVTAMIGLPPFAANESPPYARGLPSSTTWRPALEFANGIWGLDDFPISFSIIASARDTESVSASSRLLFGFKNKEEKYPWLESADS